VVGIGAGVANGLENHPANYRPGPAGEGPLDRVVTALASRLRG
jgi:hypothetical protein